MSSKTFTTALFTTAILLTFAVAVPAHADRKRDQARINFQQADANQDQLLDLAEFTTFINLNADHGLGRASTIRRFGMYGRAFGKIDTNRDGTVSRQEIAAQAQR
jgi:hypothetical protein